MGPRSTESGVKPRAGRGRPGPAVRPVPWSSCAPTRATWMTSSTTWPSSRRSKRAVCRLGIQHGRPAGPRRGLRRSRAPAQAIARIGKLADAQDHRHQHSGTGAARPPACVNREPDPLIDRGQHGRRRRPGTLAGRAGFPRHDRRRIAWRILAARRHPVRLAPDRYEPCESSSLATKSN